jgi:hypothetical protein
MSRRPLGRFPVHTSFIAGSTAPVSSVLNVRLAFWSARAARDGSTTTVAPIASRVTHGPTSAMRSMASSASVLTYALNVPDRFAIAAAA